MNRNLRFTEPGRPGAGIVNQGILNATNSGLIALIAPHVRNDGVIQARLGKVTLASGDTFALDLYGDTLVSLALSADNVGKMVDATGKPVNSLIDQAGTINAPGGKIVLMTAGTAKAVVDNVINMSGLMVADSVGNVNGEIVLAGRGGRVDVSGQIGARGLGAGETGGRVQILGDQVALTGDALIDASGRDRGGNVYVGRAAPDQAPALGEINASTTSVAPNVQINVSSYDTGNGGRATVSSGSTTSFNGTIFARGGTAVGDGGAVEIVSKENLVFRGAVDASAVSGKSGRMALNAGPLTIDQAGADGISRTLRTGTDVALHSTKEVVVAGQIDGREGSRGASLSVAAKNTIELREDIHTNNGVVTLTSTDGAVIANRLRVDPDKPPRLDPLISTGGAAITIQGTSLELYRLITTGEVSLVATAGGVNLNAMLGEFGGPIGSLTISQSAPKQSPEVRIGGVRLQENGKLTVNATGNIRLLDSVTVGSIDALKQPEQIKPDSIVLHSKKFDPNDKALPAQNLFNNSDYRKDPSLQYLGLKEKGLEASNLKNFNISDSPPGLTPPGPINTLPDARIVGGIQDLREVPVLDAGSSRSFINNPFLDSFNARLERTVSSTDDSPDDSDERTDRIVVTGGRGLAQSSDLGRAPIVRAPLDTFSDRSHVARGPACDASSPNGAGYFARNTFGYAIGGNCHSP